MLSETTLIPISLVAMIVTVAVWVSSIDAKAARNAEDISAISDYATKNLDQLRDHRIITDAETNKTLREITDRLGRIEGKLDQIRRNGP